MTVLHEAYRSHQDLQPREFITLDQAVFDAEKEQFIADCIQTLEQQSESSDILDSLSDRYSGFISQRTEVKPSPIGEGFRLDDTEIYTSLLDHSRTFFEEFKDSVPNDPNNDMAYFKAALYAVQQTQGEYFGNISPGAEGPAAHDELIYNVPGVNSVADFKNIALCVQRSAVANNMLQVLGAPVSFIMGELTLEGHSTVAHAFLLVRTPKGNTRLYDPMNPTNFFNATGQLVASRPNYPKVPAETVANGEYFETTIQAGFQQNHEYHMKSVSAVYRLGANKEMVRGIIRAKQMLDGLTLQDVVSLSEQADRSRVSTAGGKPSTGQGL